MPKPAVVPSASPDAGRRDDRVESRLGGETAPEIVRHVRSVGVLLSAALLGMWLVSGALAYLLLGLPFWVAMLLGAVVTPTDPVLAGTIVTGDLAERSIPERLRDLLTAEAGANDGGALPFVLLAVFMLEHPPGEAWRSWLVDALGREVALALLLGWLIGVLAGRVERWSRRERFIERSSLLAVTFALSAFTLGAAKLAGADGLLAVFVAGLAYRRQIDKSDEVKEERVQEAINRVVGFPVFVLFGMALPWDAWRAAGWSAPVFALLVLLLRRPPVVLLLAPALRPLRRRADALFTGWFGPVGVAALFYATFAVRETGRHEIWIHASLVILASVVLHGVSATPFTKRAGEGAPLCLVAHSLGSVVVHNFLYDLQHRPDYLGDVARPDTPLARGDTLALLCTYGSPIAIWRLRFGNDYRAIGFPGREVADRFPSLQPKWLNIFDPDDVLAFPIGNLTDRYRELVRDGFLEDRPTEVGGLLTGWSPMVHYDYLHDDETLEDLADAVVEVWRGAYPDALR